jgi:hypothetical protein
VANNEEVVCGRHGKTPVRFVCRHAGAGVACGWHVDDIVALCDRCVALPLKKVTDDIKVVCTFCWDEIRQLNEDVPPHARPGTDAERAVLQHHATQLLRERQEAAQARWRIGSDPEATVARWDLDVEAGTLTFTRDSVRTITDVRFVGSYSTITDVFQWAWVTMGEDPLATASSLLRTYGEIRGLPELAHMSIRGKLERAWELTALAGYLLGYEAAYRVPQDHLFWFVLLDRFRDE